MKKRYLLSLVAVAGVGAYLVCRKLKQVEAM
ncbi:hypothetical protein JOC94_003020 [Bacillus thermophilus]|uniref:Uncharacterized protein n=1 Tax=Siminovitchia thermophila TaxID=1245522 RepID=A0ABS2R8S2_9BACI|nr:hypothetical protein [Siminovitchia thermophila]